MLVLSRKLGEAIVIDGDIRITIGKTSGNRVSVAIDAPADIAIEREEVWQRRQEFLATANADDPTSVRT